MNKFLYLCIALGITFSEANGANLKRSKFIDFDSYKSISDESAESSNDFVDVGEGDVLFQYDLPIEIARPKPIMASNLSTFDEEDDFEDYSSWESFEIDEALNVPPNTPHFQYTTVNKISE